MRFAFCLYKYFPFGGLQRDFLHITQECLKRGHDIEVFTSSWEGPQPTHIKINIIPKKGWTNHRQNFYFQQSLQQELRKTTYDLIVGFNKMPGLDVYYAADTCYVAKVQAQRPTWYRYLPRFRKMAAFEKAVFQQRSKTRILLLSNKQQQEYRDIYQTDTERFHLLPPVIASDRVLPENAKTIRSQTRQEWNLLENDFLLLFVGSGFKTKGLDRVLQGIAHLPEEIKNRTRLFVIGKDRTNTFKRLAKKLQISSHVSFLGGRDNVPDFLLAADVLVHPAYNENTGTILLEALIYGLPVLTTDRCGYAHYITKANAGCVLASPFTQAAFDRALREMLHSHKRAEWQENAVRFTKMADLYSMPQRAVDYLESLPRIS